MTNSQALATARNMRLRVEAIQNGLDMIARDYNSPSMSSARHFTELAHTDAEELCEFLDRLSELTLNQGGTP